MAGSKSASVLGFMLNPEAEGARPDLPQNSLEDMRDHTNKRVRHKGYNPPDWAFGEVPSIHMIASHRQHEQTIQKVDEWMRNCFGPSIENQDIDASEQDLNPPPPPTRAPPPPDFGEGDDNIPDAEISLGAKTNNRHVPHQIYYQREGDAIKYNDILLMNEQTAPWCDPASVPDISYGRQQPETSAAAIRKFSSMCRDTASDISNASTWGTRWSSNPPASLIAGNFLMKFDEKMPDKSPPKASKLLEVSQTIKRSHSDMGLLKQPPPYSELLHMASKRPYADSKFRKPSLPDTPLSLDSASHSMYILDSTRTTLVELPSDDENGSEHNHLLACDDRWERNENLDSGIDIEEPVTKNDFITPFPASSVFHPHNGSLGSFSVDGSANAPLPQSVPWDSFRLQAVAEVKAQLVSSSSSGSGSGGLERDINEVDDMIPTCQALSSVSSSTHFRETARVPIRQMRQVGIVKAKFTLLSLSSQVERTGLVDDSVDADCEVNCDEDLPSETAAANTTEEHTDELLSQNNNTPSSHHGRHHLTRTGAGRENQDNEDPGGDEDMPQIPKSKSFSHKRCARFACPYQAHELFRTCLKPGRHNPDGGCDGIKRLKQHLCRRHMVSYRCQKCWKSFDSRRKAEIHQEQRGQCENKEKPSNEIFMSDEDEQGLRRLSHTGVDEEDTWWSWFKLLIPNMQSRDVPSLRLEYYPYYLRLDPSFMIPAITLPDWSFSLPNSQGNSNLTRANEFGPLENISMDTPFPLPGSSEARLPEAGFTSQELSLPLLEIFDERPSITHSNTNSSESVPTSNASLAPASSVQIPPRPCDSREPATAQCNYDRLKTRFSRVEAENTSLREANHQAQADLNRVEHILEDILESEDILANLHERIFEAVDILIKTKQALRS
ncbi:hypothetical protein F5Y01DRAFT_131004 [Xylaria sp. FL0043]|nr:hypothetical protein F5Y01DRAFT_131004 [Xylaria sp. FL0043]